MAPVIAQLPTPREERRLQQSHGAYAPPFLYLPTSRIENDPGTIGPRPPRPPGAGAAAPAGGAGGAPYSAAMMKMCPVFESRVSVLPPVIVCSVCSRTKFVGLFSLMMD